MRYMILLMALLLGGCKEQGYDTTPTPVYTVTVYAENGEPIQVYTNCWFPPFRSYANEHGASFQCKGRDVTVSGKYIREQTYP